MGTSRGSGHGPRHGIVLALAMLGGACAPTVDGPVERQRGIDREDAAHVGAQLAQLPGALSASVTLHRATRDPLSVAAPSPASAAALILVDDRADRAQITAAAATLLRATAPEITAPAIVTLVAAHRPALAHVGPFTVEATSQARLKVTLAIALALIAGLAGWIALRVRRRPGA